MKKVIIILIVILSLFFLSFLNFKEKEEKVNKNISVILETEEGNIKSNKFPNKNDYEYLNTKCENISSNINSFFNEETWKLNISVEEESIDGKFNCMVYFKEKNKLATKIIIDKYNETNNEGLIKLEQPSTVQTPALTEYRYTGVSTGVKNYVRFNNELWRIIGVFNDKIKLIRNDSIPTVFKDNGLTVGGYATYAAPTVVTKVDFFYWNYGGTNNWEDATLKKYLNGTYYESIKSDSKKLIDEEKWYLGGFGSDRPQTAREYYETERSNNVYSDNSIFTISYIGLIYPSDVYYANNPLPTSFPVHLLDDSWLNKSPLWTITASSENGSSAFTNLDTVSFYRVNVGDSSFAKYAEPLVRPTLYLKSSVKITSGTGTSSDPYQLSL